MCRLVTRLQAILLLKARQTQLVMHVTYFLEALSMTEAPYGDSILSMSSRVGCSTVLIIRSIWLSVEDPGNSGLPNSISPRMHPNDHMSTPLVYLQQQCSCEYWETNSHRPEKMSQVTDMNRKNIFNKMCNVLMWCKENLGCSVPARGYIFRKIWITLFIDCYLW